MTDKQEALKNVKEAIQNYLMALQGGKLGEPSIEDLNSAGILHRFLEECDD